MRIAVLMTAIGTLQRALMHNDVQWHTRSGHELGRVPAKCCNAMCVVVFSLPDAQTDRRKKDRHLAAKGFLLCGNWEEGRIADGTACA